MKFVLIENGADSLKRADECLDKIKTLDIGVNHNLKDAVIYLNHGVEILFKFLLSSHNPALMFSDVDEYCKAKSKAKDQGANDVFEVKPSLKTVNLTTAISRFEFICNIEVPVQLKGAILDLLKIRNQLMHYEIVLTERETEELIAKMKNCLYSSTVFFEEHIEDITDIIGLSRFEYTIEEKMQDEAEWQAEVMMEVRRYEMYD